LADNIGADQSIGLYYSSLNINVKTAPQVFHVLIRHFFMLQQFFEKLELFSKQNRSLKRFLVVQNF